MRDDGRILLAHEPDLRIGVLLLRPGLREVVHRDGRREILEPRVMQVLVALAVADGAILTRDELTERCWNGRIVGEDAINRVMWRLRRVADGIAAGVFRIETITKVGYRLVRGEPGAAAIVPSIPPPRRDWRWPVALALAVLLVVGGAGWMLHLRTLRDARTLLVEPLAVASDDRDARVLRQGLSTALARLVVGNDATISIVDPSDTAAGAGHAGFILAGDAQNDGHALHAAVRLIAGDGGTILWSSAFVRPIAEREALRQEMAAKIAAVVVCALGARNHASDSLPLATFRLFLAACEVRHSDWSKSAELLQQVVRRSPDFSHGWGMLAVATALSANWMEPRDAATAYRLSDATARRALALDPADSDAYFALLLPLKRVEDWGRRAELVHKGLAIDPDNPRFLTHRGLMLSGIGRIRDAQPYAERAAAMGPFAPVFASNLIEGLALHGRLSDSRRALDRALETWPAEPMIRKVQLQIAAKVGPPAQATALLDDPRYQAGIDDTILAIWRTLAAARATPVPAARAAAAMRIEHLAQGGNSAVLLEAIEALVLIDRVDAAYRLASRSDRLSWTEQERWFSGDMAPFRRDPRFIALMVRQGVAALWVQTGLWPDFCNEPALPYDCRAATRVALAAVGRRP